ncbi:MAG: peptidylprolyl isomerase, partial [Blastocatellia bacterium]|nr:peptidylprolyl isomerase [Blastocatellia bacterium]
MSIRKGFLRNSFICFLLFTGLFAASCKSSEIPGGDESSAIPEGGTAVIDTDYGTIKIKLAPDLAPKHVSHFIKLARE